MKRIYPSAILKRIFLYPRLRLVDWKAGRQLTCRQDNLKNISRSSIILVTCLRNEFSRIQYFYYYYKKMGVDHFIIIDNGSSDELLEWAKTHTDISIFYTEESYKKSRFGMLWCNDVLRRYGSGHWCVTVDPDEFLVYPNMETRDLKALTQHLDDVDRSCMHTIMLDAYSNKSLNETTLGAGDNPFEICPFFDRDGYIQALGWGGGTWIRGGPRLRTQFSDTPLEAPALNKIPLIKWKSYYHYNMSMHDARPFYLNEAHASGRVSITGALFHFKMVSSLTRKAREELERREHYAGSREYIRYAKSEGQSLYAEGISIRYVNSDQLVELGLMSSATWF
jgi:hypothetical protein